MLNCGDELANLLLSCIQPHRLSIADFRPTSDQDFGWSRFVFFKFPSRVYVHGITSNEFIIHFLLKQNEPDYNFVRLPHRKPMRSPVAALAIQLHYMFDQDGICSHLGDWNWSQPSSWQKV